MKKTERTHERENEWEKYRIKSKNLTFIKPGFFITCLRHLNHLRRVLRAWWSLPWWPSWSLWSRSLSTWHPRRRCTNHSSRRTLTPPVSTTKQKHILIILNSNEYLNFQYWKENPGGSQPFSFSVPPNINYVPHWNNWTQKTTTWILLRPPGWQPLICNTYESKWAKNTLFSILIKKMSFNFTTLL